MGMITSDITERKLTEEALKKSEHDLKTLFILLLIFLKNLKQINS